MHGTKKALVIAVAVLLCVSSGASAEEPEDPHSDERYATHLERLKARLPGEGFSIVIEKPFCVIGDEDEATVKRRAEGTIRWAVTKLKAAYFPKDPSRILDIWLFKDEASYYRNAEKLFGSRPGTPFGYYSPSDRALVMNIATGGGTLVHELVHPFMEANFPACPAWFNEGLGSLYEQCHERDGTIRGMTNWRLKGLKEEILSNGLPTIQELTHLSDRAFYRGARGDNYAQARYLCYYLQEEGKLRAFYERFTQSARSDPTGYVALQSVLAEEDMNAFEARWKAWVLKLRFPER